MKWTSSLHTNDSFSDAIKDASKHLSHEFGDEGADFGVLFVSFKYRQDLIDLWPTLRNELPIKNILGCTAGGVIGAAHEVEDQPAISLTAAQLPRVTLTGFSIRQENLPEMDGSPKPWRDLTGTSPEKKPHFLLISDPYSLDADSLVGGLDFAFPEALKIGGLASGGQGPNQNLLLLNEKILSRGAVGISLSGDISVESVVAQGCRPIGEPLIVSSCRDNLLLEVNNQAPLFYLSELFEKLKPRDQELIRSSLFLGLVMDPMKAHPMQGDFLIRNIIGFDQEEGLLAIGAPLRPGQSVQFHLRDADTSHTDLQTLLLDSRSAKFKEFFTAKPSQGGAILFSCLGRGERLYGKADHDSALLQSVVGNIPVGGFFCSGEIGPVGGRTYLHGYTSSIAFFTPLITTKNSKTFAEQNYESPQYR